MDNFLFLIKKRNIKIKQFKTHFSQSPSVQASDFIVQSRRNQVTIYYSRSRSETCLRADRNAISTSTTSSILKITSALDIHYIRVPTHTYIKCSRSYIQKRSPASFRMKKSLFVERKRTIY